MKGIADFSRTGRALLGWAGEDTCPYVVSFWLQRLRDHHLALEVTAFSGRLSPLRSS
jgi:hypothetical protein